MAKHKPLPPLERVREALLWSDETGGFLWRVTRGSTARQGQRAGCLSRQTGYRLIRVDNQLFLEHRLAWLWHCGVDPGSSQIDHINGKRADNRIKNLRLATNQQNMRNQIRVRRDNVSGVAGVGWSKISGKWRAYISVAGKQAHLGLFESKEQAAAARREAEAGRFGEFAPRRSA